MMTIPSSIYFGLINFSLLIGLLVFLLRRPVRDFFATRAAILRQAVEGAREARAVAEHRLQEWDTRLACIEAEMQGLRTQLREEGELARQTIIARANEYAAKMTVETERMIAQELKRTKERLRATTVDLAILMAERYLREQTTTEDQVRLAQQYVRRLGQLQ